MILTTIDNARDLRVLRKKILAEIVCKDLAQKATPNELMREWSKVADHLISSALAIVREKTSKQLKFCVIALGKLGGLELNYSSDIDLLYIYEGDHEVAAKVAHQLTKILRENTEDGFVFRVDNNLRPEGNAGQLVNTITSLERYYENTGHDWERQALIRARPVAGDMELGNEFIARVRPFVFPKSTDISILKKIRAMKMAQEKSATVAGWNNIKLGAGGIREVEFYVQALQILHGGKIPEIRVQNTFDALDALLKNDIITKKKRDELTKAYSFLRRVENLLQAKEDRQIHILPKNHDDLKELAKSFQFDSEKKFIIKLDEVRKCVQSHFASLFETSYEKLEIVEEMLANLETCKDREEISDSFAWFKNHVSKRIQELDLNGKLTLTEMSERLTFLAETILAESLKFAGRTMAENYGAARIDSGQTAEICIIGMGKLGSSEIDYGSDLDLVFVYSGDGFTSGPKKITNHEYFTKLAQSVLSMITLPTRYSHAYNIDNDLRPSGNQGVLVSSFEAFDRYHRREAQFWERQAMIRARVVAGDVSLGNRLNELIEELAFDPPIPQNIKEEIVRLRQKETQKIKLVKGQIDLKKGAGGIAGIESIVHYLQLVHARKNIRSKNLSTAMEQLKREKILNDDEYILLNNAHNLFKRVLSLARLFQTHSTGIINTNAEYFQAIANVAGFGNKNELTDKIEKMVREITRRTTSLFSPAPPCNERKGR